MRVERMIVAEVSSRTQLPHPLRSIVILTRRELRSRLGSVWFYIVATIPCLLAVMFGGGFLRAFETETVLVSADPLLGLNTAVLAFLAIVLGLRLSSSLAWEREHRTLEVLLVGPVGYTSILAIEDCRRNCRSYPVDGDIRRLSDCRSTAG
jgi:hypothetical protein